MGTWNTAMDGNDTFVDIHQRFFQYYNEGRNPIEISKELVEVFEDDLNDVDTRNNSLFGLALAQWETKSQDPELLRKVKQIIETGNDLEVWTDLGSDERVIKKRKLVLDKFLIKISAEKEKPRRRSKQKDKYFSNQLYKALSPDNKCTLTITESGTDETYCSTQIFIEFKGSGGGGGGVYAANGMNLSIKAYWKNDKTIAVETKKDYLVLQKWEQVQNFQDIINVDYIET